MVENFSELLEQSLSEFKYKEGQIIKGTVLSIVNDTVVVDVGLKAEGRIPIKEFHSPGEEHSVKVGDKYDVYLEKLENKVISFDFKKVKDEKLTGIGMVIKKMRGAMAKHIILNKITCLEKIKKFNQFKFKFYEFDNKNNKFLFITK